VNPPSLNEAFAALGWRVERFEQPSGITGRRVYDDTGALVSLNELHDPTGWWWWDLLRQRGLVDVDGFVIGGAK
jgi:hypothetical protein